MANGDGNRGNLGFFLRFNVPRIQRRQLVSARSMYSGSLAYVSLRIYTSNYVDMRQSAAGRDRLC